MQATPVLMRDPCMPCLQWRTATYVFAIVLLCVSHVACAAAPRHGQRDTLLRVGGIDAIDSYHVRGVASQLGIQFEHDPHLDSIRLRVSDWPRLAVALSRARSTILLTPERRVLVELRASSRTVVWHALDPGNSPEVLSGGADAAAVREALTQCARQLATENSPYQDMNLIIDVVHFAAGSGGTRTGLRCAEIPAAGVMGGALFLVIEVASGTFRYIPLPWSASEILPCLPFESDVQGV